MALEVSSRFRALTPREARAEIDAGAIPVDVREPAAFARAHVPGSINVPFSAHRFAERLAGVVAADATVLILGADEVRLRAAWGDRSTGRLGLRGYLDGGLEAWMAVGLPTRGLASASVRELRTYLEGGCVAVADVREPVEWEELGYIEGALLIPLGEIGKRYSELPRDRLLAVVCEQGIRSSTAASVLLRARFAAVANVPEGMAGWRMAGYPLVEWRPAGGGADPIRWGR